MDYRLNAQEKFSTKVLNSTKEAPVGIGIINYCFTLLADNTLSSLNFTGILISTGHFHVCHLY